MAASVNILPVKRVGTDRVYSAVLKFGTGEVLGLVATVSEPLYRRLAASVGMLQRYLRSHVHAPPLSDLAGGNCLVCDVPGRAFQMVCDTMARADAAGRALPTFAEVGWNFDHFEGIENRLLGDVMATWAEHGKDGVAGPVPTHGFAARPLARPGTSDLLHRYALAAGYL